MNTAGMTTNPGSGTPRRPHSHRAERRGPRRWLAAVASLALMMGLSLAVAPTASAADTLPAPTVTQPKCVAGDTVSGSVSVGSATNVTDYGYSINGNTASEPDLSSVAPGATVKIVAWVSSGSTVAGNGWKDTDNSSYTYTVTLNDPDCGQTPDQTPLPGPEITQAQCVDGDISEPSVSVEQLDGVDHYVYYVNGTEVDDLSGVQSGDTVKIVAWPTTVGSFDEGNGWEFPEQGGDGQLIYTTTLDESTPCGPPDVEITQAQCVDGDISEPSVSVEQLDGVNRYVYYINGEESDDLSGVQPGDTVKIVAWPETVGSFDEGNGWQFPEQGGDGQLIYTTTLDEAPDCTTETTDTTDTTGSTPPGSGLPETGVNTRLPLGIGLALLLLGGGALLLTRRRQGQH